MGIYYAVMDNRAATRRGGGEKEGLVMFFPYINGGGLAPPLMVSVIASTPRIRVRSPYYVVRVFSDDGLTGVVVVVVVEWPLGLARNISSLVIPFRAGINRQAMNTKDRESFFKHPHQF